MIMMIKWFDQAKGSRHHQMKAMGKPRVAREMDILQTSTFLSFLATEEPHVRPCEVVQGLKMYSSWFWCSQLCEICSSVAGHRSNSVCCWRLGPCRRGTGRVAAFIAERDPAEEWETCRLVFLCTNLIHGGYCMPSMSLQADAVLLVSSTPVKGRVFRCLRAGAA